MLRAFTQHLMGWADRCCFAIATISSRLRQRRCNSIEIKKSTGAG
jgi:hypothetical protein